MDDESPEKKFGKLKEKFTLSINFLFRYSDLKTKIFTIIGLSLAIFNGAIFPTFMFLMAKIAVQLIMGNSTQIIVYALLILSVVAFFINGISTALLEYVSSQQVKNFRMHFFRSVLRQDMNWYDSTNTATLVTKLEENLVQIREALGNKLSFVFMSISMLVFAIGFSFYSEPRLAAVLVIGYPIMMIAMFFTSQTIVSSQRKSIKAYESAGAIAEEATMLVRMVRANNSEQRMKNWYTNAINWAEKVMVNSYILSSIGIGCLMFLLYIMYTVGIYYGGFIAAASVSDNPGEIFPADTIIRVMMLMAGSSMLLGQIAPLLMNISKGISAAMDLSAIIDRVPDIDINDTSGIKDMNIEGKIEFKNVSYSYPSSDKPIFDKLSFTVYPGQTIAFVGPSGIGKSTITSLLQRFYDPTEGEIFLDDNPLKSYNLRFLRSKMAIISQQPRLFSMSIRDNIHFGNVNNDSNNEIVKAAQYAYAHSFIDLFPNKYDTQAGEGGSALSGGQKQRIAIARAMFRKPSIYILDEATAALDVESEKLVQRAFDNLMGSEKKSTTIIVAHRLSTIKNADHIFVFGRNDDKTEILEQGDHTTLISNPYGTYYKMMTAQLVDFDSNSSSTVSDQESHIELEKQQNSLIREFSNYSGIHTQKSEVIPTKTSTLWNAILNFKLFDKTRDKTVRNLVLKFISQDPIPVIFFIISSICMGLSFPSIAFFITEYMQILSYSDHQQISKESRNLSLLALGLAVAVFLFAFLQFFNVSKAGTKLISRLRKHTFDVLMDLPISFYDDPKNSVGYISSILSADVNLINQGYILNTGITLQMATTFIFAFAYAFFSNWLFAISLLIPFLLLLPFTTVRSRKSKEMNNQIDVANTQSSAFLLHETLIGINSVMSYGLQDTLYNRYQKLLANEQGKPVIDAVLYGFAMGISAFGAFAINALGFHVGSLTLQNNPDNALNIARSMFLIMFASRSINQNSMFTADMKKAKAGERHLCEILKKDDSLMFENITETSDLEPEKLQGSISIRNLKFTYPMRSTPVYDNVSFDIKPGETVAIVGESGSGKSTVVQLLEKFYNYNTLPPFELRHTASSPSLEELENMILIDGVPLCHLSAQSVRKQIGYVSQDPSIFNTTILENIRMGKPEATEEEIHNACISANIHDFIMELPDQYKTQTGRLGSKLSGGQKQRIAIARAIIRNPKILLLDEATSALDSQGEQIVQASLDSLLSEKNRTSLVIAHRLSTIKNADKIVVFKPQPGFGSRVVESGTHNDLVNLNGIYHGMITTATQ